MFQNMTRHLLILDLDETLIHATEGSLERPPDFTVFEYAVYKRPFVDEFLAQVSEWFDLALWSSSGAEYLREVAQRLFGDVNRLKFIWHRGRCTLRHNLETDVYYHRKDLKKVKRKGYCLEKVIVVDDSPEKLERQYGNLVAVAPFEGDEKDLELKYLLHYLGTLRIVDNVRTVEKRGWREWVKNEAQNESAPTDI